MLKPKFVILENVRGILSFRLENRKLSSTQQNTGIGHGIVKLLRRLLTAMKYDIVTLTSNPIADAPFIHLYFPSYQVRYGMLHAGQYGAPQVRRRIIFIAAKRGIPLPNLPQATHLTPEPTVLDLVIEDHGRFAVNKKGKEVAPLGTVTVQDTIGDMPAREW
jgi:DNA (cytosine-5)-methyltransferase 1